MNNLFKKSSTVLLLFVLTISFWRCADDNNPDYEFTYETIVTEQAVNLEEINSSFDDYNSALPYEGIRYGIYFSTNRNSSGANFDIIYKELDISYHEKDDILNISFVSNTNTYDRLEEVIQEIKTEDDELGPYHYWGQENYEYFLYANNSSGNFDIQYVSKSKENEGVHNPSQALVSINSEFDDLYPSISNDDIYFCSNRENNIFNIYSTTFDEKEMNPDIEEPSNSVIEINNILSSPKDDKCPYIEEDLMVFTSDRAGGYGGFDLYYSKRIDGIWTVPVNMGENVNSESDEYRPVIVPFLGFGESMLIFSSNREGGKGGFDLYSARVPI